MTEGSILVIVQSIGHVWTTDLDDIKNQPYQQKKHKVIHIQLIVDRVNEGLKNLQIVENVEIHCCQLGTCNEWRQ
jgi:hypothetical protein